MIENSTHENKGTIMSDNPPATIPTRHYDLSALQPEAAIPQGIYKLVIQAIFDSSSLTSEEADAIANANGMWLFEAFPPTMHSWDTTQAYIAKDLKARGIRNPRINFLAAIDRVPVDHIAHAISVYRLGVRDSVVREEHMTREMKAEAQSQFNLNIFLDPEQESIRRQQLFVRLNSQLQNTNASQQHRDYIASLDLEIQHLLTTIHNMMRTRLEPRGYHLRLRHPVTFLSQMLTEFKDISHLRGIPDFVPYMNEAQCIAWYSINAKWPLFFSPVDSHFATDELESMKNYYTAAAWLDSTASASIHNLYLAPAGVTPPLVKRVEPDSFPIAISRNRRPGLIEDEVFTIESVAAHFCESMPQEQIATLDTLINNHIPEAHADWLARFLTLTASLASLHIFNTRLGRGHHKLKWIQSPINATFARATIESADAILSSIPKDL